MAFSIIIPSRNATNLVACVKAVTAAGEKSRIIVVDDGVDWRDPHFKHWVEYEDIDPQAPKCAHGYCYTDEEIAGGLKIKHDGFNLASNFVPGTDIYRIQGAKPFVFARNINIGIRAAGEDDVVLLNDDALLEGDEGFGALEAASGLLWTGKNEYVYGVVGATTNLTGQILQQRRFPRELAREVPHIAFVCVYIPRRTINQIGMLDERYCEGYGCDDRDYCEAVNAAGLKVGVSDWCYVDHGSLTSSFRGDPKTGGDFSRNLAIFKEKWPEAKL